MKINKRVIINLFLLAIMVMGSFSAAYAVRVKSDEDAKIAGKLIDVAVAAGDSYGARIVAVAKALEGTPYAEPADNDSIGTVVANLHGFDKLGFINNVLAIVKASRKVSPTFNDYQNALVEVSRRKGVDIGFPSQLIYVSDWIVDNTYRGNIEEKTEYSTGGGFKTKTLDYVSRHKEEFPALKDSTVLDKVKLMEMGYRSHRIPHLKKQSINNKTTHELLADGDIIVLLANDMDFDLYDIGFVEMKNGMPYLIHLSRETGKVVEDEYPLPRLFKIENQHFYGYRWLRPKE